MSGQGGGVGDDQQETQRNQSSHTGSDESIADIVIQFRIPGTQRVSIPLGELHSVIENALHSEQETPISTSDAEADRLIARPPNMGEGGHLTRSSAPAPDRPTAVPKIATLVLGPPSGSVRQQNLRPVGTVRPQPAYNLSDIYGQGILTRGPIPPPSKVTVRGARSAVASFPISVDMEQGSSMTETLRQEDVDSVGQARQMCPQIPSGNPMGPPEREAKRPMQLLETSCGSSVSQQAEVSVLEQQPYSPGSPVPMEIEARAQSRQVSQPSVLPEHNASPSTVASTQEPTASLQTMYGARIDTSHGNPPTEGEIILTPANESVLEDVPETNAPKYNPEPQQQAVEHNVAQPSDDDMTSKAGAKIGTTQPSTDFSGKDETHASICMLFEGVQEGPNLNEEPETRPRIQVSPAHSSCQMPHASSCPSDVLPVAQASRAVHPESSAADLHQANHPICTSIQPQQPKTVENAGSTYDFTELAVIFMQDKSTQVDTELDQRGDGPIHNPSKIQMENIDTYNNPAASSQMSPTVGNTPEMMETDNDFSLNGRTYAKAQDIIAQMVFDPNLHCTLTPGSIQCPGGVPTYETGMRQSEVASDSADTHGRERPSGGSPLPRGTQDSLWPIENLGVAQSCAGGGTGPTAVSHQHLTTEAPQGGQKRHFDPNEVDSPTAKKQAMSQLGTEFQCVPLSTTYLPQQKDSKPPSVVQETFIDTVAAGDLSQTEEHILTCPYESTLACDSLKSTGRLVDIQSSNKGNENEITSDSTQETMLAESVSVFQNIHCEHEQDVQDNNDAVDLESHNAAEECPDEIMAVLQQLNAESSDYEKAKNYVTLDSEDCRLELDETETQAGKDRKEGKQQTAEEQVNDYPPNDLQIDDERSISDQHEIQTNSVNDSDLSVPQKVVRISYPTQELEGITIEFKLEFLIIRDQYYATTVAPSTSDSTTVQTGQSKEGHSNIIEPEFSVQTQCAEGSNTSNIEEVEFVGNKYEVVATPGYIPNKISFETPVIGKVSFGFGQEGITEENGRYIPNQSSSEVPKIGKLSIGIEQEGITEENGGYIPNRSSCEVPKIGKLSIGIGQEGITEENGGYISNQSSCEVPKIGMLSIGIGQEGITEENGGYISNQSSCEVPKIGKLSIGIGQEGISAENGGYLPNKTSCEAPIIGNVSIGIGQVRITEENGMVHLHTKLCVGDYDIDEESGNLHEKRGNECEPVGREDNSSSQVVTRHAQERNMDSDCNVPTENEAVHDIVTSVAEVLAITEHKEVELIVDNERNIPPEDIDSKLSNI